MTLTYSEGSSAVVQNDVLQLECQGRGAEIPYIKICGYQGCRFGFNTTL